MLFFNFCFFHFSKFEMIIVKNLIKNHPLLKWISRVLMKVYYVQNVFDLHTFDNETTHLLKSFEISTEMHFVSLFSLHQGNITISLLMIHLKCDVVHCANLNSSLLDKDYLRAVEYAISFFFNFLFMFILTMLLSRASFFDAKFQNSFQDVAT